MPAPMITTPALSLTADPPLVSRTRMCEALRPETRRGPYCPYRGHDALQPTQVRRPASIFVPHNEVFSHMGTSNTSLSASQDGSPGGQATCAVFRHRGVCWASVLGRVPPFFETAGNAIQHDADYNDADPAEEAHPDIELAKACYDRLAEPPAMIALSNNSTLILADTKSR